MTQDDTLQTSLRSDVVDTLDNLSTSTGGFLVTQTNDFGKPLARIGEDIRGYYEAFYVPSTPAAPGQFRKIEVRVTRKDARVQSRSGYYTTPPSAAGAFAAFAGAQLPADFEVRSHFYRFGREDGGPFDCLVKIEASLTKAEFKQDPEKGRLVGRMALVGRVLDGKGGVVETFGQDVALGGTPEQIEASRAQTLPLARRLKLPPGNYTVEFLVRDVVGDKSTGQRLALTVPAPEGALAMSSLVVVSAVEPVDPKSDPTDPLRIADQRIVPNLGRPVVAAPGASLPIYYTVYVKPGASEARDRDRRGQPRRAHRGARLLAAAGARRRGADHRPLAHPAAEAAAGDLRREGQGLEGEPLGRGDDDRHGRLLARSASRRITAQRRLDVRRSVGSAPMLTRTIQRPSSVAGREVGGARAVDAVGPREGVPVEGLALEAGRLVADAHRLQRHRGEDAPVRRSSTSAASHRAFSMSRRSRAWRPETPCSRMRHHSLSARNRRPRGMPQSRRFLTFSSTALRR